MGRETVAHGTCIVAIKEKDRIIIGSDCNVARGYSISSKDFAKLFRLGPMTIGVAGQVRLLQLVKYGIDGDSYKGLTGMKALMTLTEDIYELLTIRRDPGESDIGGELFVILDKNMYVVDVPNLAVIPIDREYWAIGSGEDYALAALHITSKKKMTAKERIKLAIHTAAEFNFTIGTKIKFKEVLLEKKK